MTLEQWKSVADRSLLRVTLTVKNTSEVLLRIESGAKISVQQGAPKPEPSTRSAPETRAEAIHARERAEARRTSGSGETKIGQRERTMQIKLAPGPPKLPPKPAPPQGPRKRREV